MDNLECPHLCIFPRCWSCCWSKMASGFLIVAVPILRDWVPKHLTIHKTWGSIHFCPNGPRSGIFPPFLRQLPLLWVQPSESQVTFACHYLGLRCCCLMLPFQSLHPWSRLWTVIVEIALGAPSPVPWVPGTGSYPLLQGALSLPWPHFSSRLRAINFSQFRKVQEQMFSLVNSTKHEEWTPILFRLIWLKTLSAKY